MRRREFLIGGGSALVLGLGAAWLRHERPSPTFAKTAAPATRLDLPPDFVPPHRLGRGAWEAIAALAGADVVADRSIAMNPNAESAAQLEDTLIARLQLEEELQIDAATFSARLATAVQDDFRQGRLCDDPDWVLSATECLVARLRHDTLGNQADATAMEEAFRDGHIADIGEWGPQGTEVDTPVNVQTDGHSGIWIKAAGAPPWTQFEIGGERVRTIPAPGNVLTTGLYGALQPRILSQAGEYPVALVDPMARVRQEFGVFVVRPKAPRAQLADGSTSEVFCTPTEWGPRETSVGIPANPQPDGSEALWIKVPCAPETTRVWFGDTALRTTVSDGLITARVPIALIGSAGRVEVTLRDRHSGETLSIGDFTIVAADARPAQE